MALILNELLQTMVIVILKVCQHVDGFTVEKLSWFQKSPRIFVKTHMNGEKQAADCWLAYCLCPAGTYNPQPALARKLS